MLTLSTPAKPHPRSSPGGTVLHLSSDLANTNIYCELMAHLEKLGIAQVAYAAVRSEREAAWNPPVDTATRFFVRHILRPHDRLLFRLKIIKVARDVREQIDLKNISLIHAHFLYSDGAVALRTKKRHGIPYIVAVRNTDLNKFRRYRPDLSGLCNEILSEASRIVFISPAYRAILQAQLPARLRSVIEDKAIVVPNGINTDWLTSPSPAVNPVKDVLRLIYVGNFNRNKNISGVLQAVSILSARQNVQLTLVGGGGSGAGEVRRLLKSGRYRFARHIGRVENGPRLRAIYGEHDLFVMPSFHETFGVAYIEALSQGLPIVYSQGQGIDGYFPPGTIGEGADPKDPADIAEKIEILSRRRHTMIQECVIQAQRFGWQHIAGTYSEMYASVLMKGSSGPT